MPLKIKLKQNSKVISMNKFLVNLIPLLFLTTMGFYSAATFNNQQKMDDWVGEYEAIKPNFIEAKILTKKHNVKKALYQFSKTKYMYLRKDYTFSFFEISANKDTTFYEGTWELTDNTPLLHFKKENRPIEKLNFSKRVYYVDYLKPCHDTTQRVMGFNLFKRID